MLPLMCISRLHFGFLNTSILHLDLACSFPPIQTCALRASLTRTGEHVLTLGIPFLVSAFSLGMLLSHGKARNKLWFLALQLRRNTVHWPKVLVKHNGSSTFYKTSMLLIPNLFQSTVTANQLCTLLPILCFMSVRNTLKWTVT